MWLGNWWLRRMERHDHRQENIHNDVFCKNLISRMRIIYQHWIQTHSALTWVFLLGHCYLCGDLHFSDRSLLLIGSHGPQGDPFAVTITTISITGKLTQSEQSRVCNGFSYYQKHQARSQGTPRLQNRADYKLYVNNLIQLMPNKLNFCIGTKTALPTDIYFLL